MKQFNVWCSALAVALTLGVFSQGVRAQEAPTQNIVEVAIAAGDFTTLVAAVQAAELDSVLADESMVYTVFAPTDDAFALLGDETINALLADTDTLSDILLYHVIGGAAVDAATAISLAGSTTEAANGDKLALSLRNGALFINNSQVVVTDIAASNGVIHVIDAVLIPPAESAAATGNIVETAVNAGAFSTLIAAAQAAGLDGALADESVTYTVFAPTDDAFAKLGDETIAALLADPDTLADILLYHVVPEAAVDSITALALAGQAVTMANGANTAISVNDGTLFINDSAVTAADVLATNGVIHVIDTVLIPPTEATQTLVQSVYIAFYGRPADQAGLAWWASRLAANGNDLMSILMDFSNSAEFSERYGDLSDEELLNTLYQQLFGRDIDPEGAAFYGDALASGALTLQSIALDVLNGAINEDRAIIDNKLAAAELFTSLLATEDFSYSGTDAAEAARALLDQVGADTVELDALINAFFGGSAQAAAWQALGARGLP